MAAQALRRLGLDRVIWLVTPGNPLKAADPAGALGERVSLVERVAKGPSFVVSDIEARMGLRYSLDTVLWLKARFPGVRFVWIMGADSLASFDLWKGWTDLVREIPIAVVSRPGLAIRSRFSPMARRFAQGRLPLARARSLAFANPPAWIYIPAPFHFISSTDLRKRGLKKTGHRAT